MSRTRHHRAPPKERLLKLPDKYTGWTGEGWWAQEGRRFRKKLEHRAQRRQPIPLDE